MLDFPKFLLLLTTFTLSISASGQDLSSSDVILNTATISTPVHFRKPDGQHVLVPTGTYWVIPGTETLDLFRIEDGGVYTIRAIPGEHSEDMGEALVLSTSGTDEQPDVHSVAYLHPDGSELVAEGTYSGIEARGKLQDKARAAAAAARAKARRAAALAKRRALEAAQAARRKAEQVATKLRREARAETGRLLKDVAATRARDGKGAAIGKLILHTPRLTIASARSFTPRQKARLIQEAKSQLRAHMPFIKEVARRATGIIPLVRDTGEALSSGQRAKIQEAIWGSGDDQLRHPFAGSMVTTRGLGDGIQPSWSIGLSGDVSAVAGAGVGAAVALPFNLLDPGFCNYVSASFDLGAQAGGAANVDIGFYLGGYRTLGASSVDTILGGLEAQVTLGITVYAGVEVTLVFSIPSEDLAYIPLTAIQLGIGGGGEAEAALGLGYGIRAGCIPLD